MKKNISGDVKTNVKQWVIPEKIRGAKDMEFPGVLKK